MCVNGLVLVSDQTTVRPAALRCCALGLCACVVQQRMALLVKLLLYTTYHFYRVCYHAPAGAVWCVVDYCGASVASFSRLVACLNIYMCAKGLLVRQLVSECCGVSLTDSLWCGVSQLTHQHDPSCLFGRLRVVQCDMHNNQLSTV